MRTVSQYHLSWSHPLIIMTSQSFLRAASTCTRPIHKLFPQIVCSVFNNNNKLMALWIVCLLAAATCAAEIRRPVLRAAPTAVTTGNYMVVLRRNTTMVAMQNLLSKASKHADDAKIHRYVKTVAKAFTLKLSPYTLEVVSHRCCRTRAYT